MDDGLTIPLLVFGGVTLGILLLSALLKYREQGQLDAEWEREHPRAAFKYCGMTVHFYEPSHGNQIEYLAPDGRCYLWYPGNWMIVVGRWRADEFTIQFQYGTNTFNPVTGVTGGKWEVRPIEFWSDAIVEAVDGDPLGLRRHLPYVLGSHPRIRSLRDPRSPERN